MHLHIYTDGSQIKQPRRAPKTGYGFYIREWNTRVSQSLPGVDETNNRAELTAIAHSLEWVAVELPGKEGTPAYPTRILIYTDSQYALQVIRKWVLFDNDSVINAPNADIIARVRDGLRLCIRNVPVEFMKVQAHTALTDDDSIGNHIADELANSAAEDCCRGQTVGIPDFRFGKYKGLPVTMASDSYFDWLQKELANDATWTKDVRIRANLRDIMEWKAQI